MEKEFLIKNKFKSLSLDYYEGKHVDDYKIFNSIINNSKFNLTLTTNTFKDKKYYQDQFKYLEEQFELNTINDVKNEKKVNESVESSLTNKLKMYTEKIKMRMRILLQYPPHLIIVLEEKLIVFY